MMKIIIEMLKIKIEDIEKCYKTNKIFFIY